MAANPDGSGAILFPDALHQQVRKQIELKVVSAGIEIKPDDPKGLRLADSLQQYADDQKLLKDSKNTLAAHRITVAAFLESCNRTFLDQLDRRDLLRYADTFRKGGFAGSCGHKGARKLMLTELRGRK